MVSAGRLDLNVSEAEPLQFTTAPTITNTGDRIAVTQTAADRAVQREAVAAPIAAMSSAVIPEVPVCTDAESEHKTDMNEVAGVVKELFHAGWRPQRRALLTFVKSRCESTTVSMTGVIPLFTTMEPPSKGVRGMKTNDWMILPNLAHDGTNRCAPGAAWAIKGNANAISFATLHSQAMSYAGPVRIYSTRAEKRIWFRLVVIAAESAKYEKKAKTNDASSAKQAPFAHVIGI